VSEEKDSHSEDVFLDYDLPGKVATLSQSIFQMVGVVIVEFVDTSSLPNSLISPPSVSVKSSGHFLTEYPFFSGCLSSVEHNGGTHESVRCPCHLFAPYLRPLGLSRRLHISLIIDNSNRDLFAYNSRGHCIVPQSDPEIEERSPQSGSP
jgi:hypothetical protein